MYKANGRLVAMMFNKNNVDKRIELIEDLKEEFKREGIFEAFKHTSSYVEIPPINQSNESGTYIRRKYKGVELVSFGATLYFVECEELIPYLATKPRFLYLANSGLRVIRVDDCFKYMNKNGRQFQQKLLKSWNDLTLPVFGYKHY